MRILPDGTVEIKNSQTGEVKVVRPEELPNYGISNDVYLAQKAWQDRLNAQPQQPIQPTQEASQETPQAPEQRESWLRNIIGGMVSTLKGGYELTAEAGEKLGLYLNPHRQEIMKKVAEGKTLTEDERKSLEKYRKKWQAQYIPQEELSLYKPETAGKALISAGKRVAGTGAFAVPGGGVAAGATTGALYGFAQPTEEVADIWQSSENAIIGGITGGVVAWGFGKIGEMIRGGGKAAQKTGESWRIGRGAAETQAKPGAFYAEEVADLSQLSNKAKTATGIEMKGGPQQQLEVVPKVWEALTGKIKGLLNSSDDVAYGDFFQNLDDEFAKTNWMDNKATYQTAKKEFEKRLIQTLQREGKKSINAYNLKNELSKELTKTFTKIEKGGTLTPSEEVRVALWSSLKKSLDNVSPQIREYNTLQHGLDSLAKGLVKETKTGGVSLTLPVQTGKIGGEQLKGLQDVAGRVLAGAGGGVSKALEAIPPQLGKAISRVAPLAATEVTRGTTTRPAFGPTPMNVTEPAIPDAAAFLQELQSQSQGMAGGGTLTLPNGRTVTRDEVFNKMLTDPANKAIYTQIINEIDRRTKVAGGGGLNVGTPTAQNYTNAKTGMESLNAATPYLFDVEGELRRDVVLALKTPGTFATNSDTMDKARKAKAQLYNIADSYLRIRTGAQANPAEIKRLAESLEPGLTDSADVVNEKLSVYKSVFNEIIKLAMTPKGETTPSLETFGEASQ